MNPITWDRPAASYFSDFQRLNPSAVPLSRDDTDLPPFLLLQTGGGVEGLQLQACLLETGQLFVWRSADLFVDPDLEHPQLFLADEQTVARMFSLARAVQLTSEARVEYCCDVLDGGVVALFMYEHGLIGHVRYLNSRTPSGPIGVLATFLEGLAIGSTQRSVTAE